MTKETAPEKKASFFNEFLKNLKESGGCAVGVVSETEFSFMNIFLSALLCHQVGTIKFLE